ncbi:hypothetical protein KC19_10G155000 [Ceratodon purpureus]|uniref:Uncharacterized protein n=1 Tax=Ceratodon purpureus TaxID=3225 RepID=A0A8T0GQY6_CERPU|nr:hypothetical protein KC19_10G155000 [Ceratodon purpureus]
MSQTSPPHYTKQHHFLDSVPILLLLPNGDGDGDGDGAFIFHFFTRPRIHHLLNWGLYEERAAIFIGLTKELEKVNAHAKRTAVLRLLGFCWPLCKCVLLVN